MFFPSIEMSFEIESEPVTQEFFLNWPKNLSWFNQEITCENANGDVCQIAFMMRLG